VCLDVGLTCALLLGCAGLLLGCAGLLLGCAAPTKKRPAQSVQGGSVPGRVVAVVPSSVEGAELCFNAWDDNNNTLIDEGCGVHQGQLQIVLAWSNRDVDLDLIVTDPCGDVAGVDKATRSGLTLSTDCPQPEAGCSEQPYENVYREQDDILSGRYWIVVRLTSELQSDEMIVAQLGLRQLGETRAFSVELSRNQPEARYSFFVEQQEIPEGPVTTGGASSRSASEKKSQKTQPKSVAQICKK
jgi:tRNA (guanosine-2'-O-)-methyltransferase